MLRRFGSVTVLLCGVFFASCGGRAQSSSDASHSGAGGSAGSDVARGGAPSDAGPPLAAGSAGEGGSYDSGGAGGEPDHCEKGGGFAINSGGAAANAQPTSIAPRTLQIVANHGAWTSTRVVAMAASETSVFVATPDEIDQIDGATVSPYLTVQQAAASAGLSVAAGFRALDIDANGTLYSILSSTLIRSKQAGQAAVWRRDPSLAVQLGVVGVDDVALISMQSMFRVRPHCASRLFTNGEFLGLDCGGAQLSVASSGSFLYAADCGVNQLYRGTADGASFDVIYAASTPPTAPLNATQFVCSTRDPAGGFYLVVDDGNAWQLVHLIDSPSGTTGLDFIATSPTFAEARAADASLGLPPPFTSCKLAARANGTLFLHTDSKIFELQVTP